MEDASLSRPTTVLGPLSRRAEWWPLTERQSLIWADDRLLANTRYHHWILSIRFDGWVDVERFEEAWLATVRGHDALSLIVDTRAPRQRFAVGLPGLRIIDLPQDISIEHWVSEQSTREYASARQPWDAVLVRHASGECAFVFRAHYLVCDERSFYIIARELDARYSRRSVEPSGKSFREFLLADSIPNGTDRSEHDRAAWETLLADAPPIAELLGCVRTNDDASVARKTRWRGGDTHARLSAFLSGNSKLTTSACDACQLLIAAVTLTWLHMLTGQNDLVVSVVLDRRDEDSQAAVGLLSELYFLRVVVSEEETFRSLLDKVATAYRFVCEHSQVALGDPGCVSAFVGSSPNWPESFCGNAAFYRLGGAPIFTTVGLGSGDGRNDLAIRVAAAGRSLGLNFDFNRRTYCEDVQTRLVDHYTWLLDSLLESPDRRFDELDWIPSHESTALVCLGKGEEPAHAPDLLARFSHWAAVTPTETALEFHDQSLTYAEIDRITDRIARRLQALGVGQESRVAVAMPRGVGEVVALVATLKAGGAYVPVDPSHPIERVRIILEDACPQVVIAPTHAPIANALPEHACLFPLDDVDVGERDIDEARFDQPTVNDDQLAYILFTSGSTGRPKGVEIPRSAFANFLQSMQRVPGLTDADRVLAITTTTFDIAGLEIFLPLYVGATIVLADKDTSTDPVLLRELIERSAISLMQATPATWRLLLDAGWTGDPKLRMLCGGEAMSLALATRLLESGAELWNMYGPTETTVWSTLEQITPAVTRISIGRPIDHTQITLRRPNGRFVARGAIGEVCIGGKGLARAYRGRPDLTEKAFRFDRDTGERYYRTGDLGRYLTDGRLECLGRIDHQIKIRGFRIEPADIEAQLRKVAGVKDVVVLARGSGGEEPQLVAYWVGSATREMLIQAARAHLPNYMVPSAYVALQSFPLTTSGKVDRKQLPGPSSVVLQISQKVAIGPRNDRESIVASMFCQLLGVAQVSVDDDFFGLGGTSVRAVQLRAKIADALGISLPLRTIFDARTVEAIVAQLDNCPSPDDPVVSWTKASASRIPWIGIMGIHLFEGIADALPPEQPFIGLHIPARFVPGMDPFPSVVSLARKYVCEIRKHQPQGPYFLLGLCHGGVVAFETGVQLEALGQRVGSIALLDAELPRARHVGRGTQFSHLIKGLVRDPQRMSQKALIAVGNAMRGLQRVSDEPSFDIGDGEPIDMPFDGPEIDRELATYESLLHRTQAHLLTFRATKNDLPAWITVDRDLGWSERARELTCIDIAASHLGIVRGAAAREVARCLDQAKSRAGA